MLIIFITDENPSSVPCSRDMIPVSNIEHPSSKYEDTADMTHSRDYSLKCQDPYRKKERKGKNLFSPLKIGHI